jgi:hypothetical protein
MAQRNRQMRKGGIKVANDMYDDNLMRELVISPSWRGVACLRCEVGLSKRFQHHKRAYLFRAGLYLKQSGNTTLRYFLL